MPPRTEVEINPNVVERPGVPPELHGVYWWNWADAGLLGTTAQIGIPSAEHIVHVAGGLVVSELPAPDRDRGSDLIVRDFATGAVVRDVRTAVVGVDALVVGRDLIWTGMTPGAPGADPIDGGVWTLDLDAHGDPVAIVEAGRVLDAAFSSRTLLMSPSARTLSAVMHGYAGPVWIDVIDVDTLTRRDRVRDAWPWAVTDDTYVMWDMQPSGFLATGWGITAYSLETQGVRWRFPAATDVDRFAPFRVAALGSGIVVQYTWTRSRSESELILSLVDTLTGQRRVLLRQDDGLDEDLLFFESRLSVASHLVLEPQAGAGEGDRTLSVLDVATGTFTPDAFVLDLPWYCTNEHCFRD